MATTRRSKSTSEVCLRRGRSAQWLPFPKSDESIAQGSASGAALPAQCRRLSAPEVFDQPVRDAATLYRGAHRVVKLAEFCVIARAEREAGGKFVAARIREPKSDVFWSHVRENCLQKSRAGNCR